MGSIARGRRRSTCTLRPRAPSKARKKTRAAPRTRMSTMAMRTIASAMGMWAAFLATGALAQAGDNVTVVEEKTKTEPELLSQKCQPNENNEFIFKVNLWEYQYEVEGCEGVAPTLEIKRGVEYTLTQKDVTNWFHPLGLAYYPDGAHDDVPELEEPTPAECDEDQFKCNPGEGVKQAPLYCIGGECETYEDWNNGTVSGLDVYEPAFQIPEDQWEEAVADAPASYSVKITIPEDSKTKEFCYFCHIHSGMSGLMVVTDPAEDANELVTPFNVDKDTYCPGMTFLCDPTGTPFSQCMEAIDCKMNYEMKEKETNKLAVFMEQMIPHHWNAILMSRIALKHSTDADGFDDEDLNVPQLMRNIINVQMQQIQEMQGWLEKYSEPTVVCPAK